MRSRIATRSRRTPARRCAAACTRPICAARASSTMGASSHRTSEHCCERARRGAALSGRAENTMTEPAWLDLVDLACEDVGGAAIACNDEFFAEKENLLRA